MLLHLRARKAFGTWFSMVLHGRGEEVLRVKGRFDGGEAGPVLLNAVQHVIRPPEAPQRVARRRSQNTHSLITRGIRFEDLLTSLEAFRCIVGARPRPLETNALV